MRPIELAKMIEDRFAADEPRPADSPVTPEFMAQTLSSAIDHPGREIRFTVKNAALAIRAQALMENVANAFGLLDKPATKMSKIVFKNGARIVIKVGSPRLKREQNNESYLRRGPIPRKERMEG